MSRSEFEDKVSREGGLRWIWERRNGFVAVLALAGILSYFLFDSEAPLGAVYAVGAPVLLAALVRKALKGDFGSDLLAGLSIVVSLMLDERLAGVIVILMLSGGETLERLASERASSVLRALAKRMPSRAHLREAGGALRSVSAQDLREKNVIVVLPHEVFPVDGEVTEGRGSVDEAYLTGEPFRIQKTVGSSVLSGSINGESSLVVRVTRRAHDSRYAKILQVMRESEQRKPRLRRLGDRLGAWYTPLALGVAALAWAYSGDPVRFLSVLVVATPCPLLIAIPIAIIGSVSLAAKRSIVVKSPSALEQASLCRSAFFDKTGTLTYGEPRLTSWVSAEGVEPDLLLAQVAGLERYSKHPLAGALLREAERKGLSLPEASEVHEPPGHGLRGRVGGNEIEVTGRVKLAKRDPGQAALLPSSEGGLECVALVNGSYAGIFRFHDAPRVESRSFVSHLGPRHHFDRVMILSGDRDSEVRLLARQVGIAEHRAQQSPEEKLRFVEEETRRGPTLYVGDGINDAPAMRAATVGIAMGQNSEVTSEAAGVVILDNSLKRVDEFIHISERMRSIALQSAVGGMLLSALGMGLAAGGHLSPVQGALLQEVIDVLAILNALRAAWPPRTLSDFGAGERA